MGSQDPDENGVACNNIVRNNTVINSDECCIYLNVSENNLVENNIFICDSDPIDGDFVKDNSIENNASNKASDLPGDNLTVDIDTDKGISIDNKKGTADLKTTSDLSDYGVDSSYVREEKNSIELLKDTFNKARRIMTDPR